MGIENFLPVSYLKATLSPSFIFQIPSPHSFVEIWNTIFSLCSNSPRGSNKNRKVDLEQGQVAILSNGQRHLYLEAGTTATASFLQLEVSSVGAAVVATVSVCVVRVAPLRWCSAERRKSTPARFSPAKTRWKPPSMAEQLRMVKSTGVFVKWR